MPELELKTRTIEAAIMRYGAMSAADRPNPVQLKIQTMGPGPETWFEDGPAEGKLWDMTVTVQITETDA